MALIITPQQEIDAYYKSDSVSRSDFLDLAKDLHKFVESKRVKEDEDDESTEATKVAFKIGGGVDCLLTSEEGAFEERYAVTNLAKMPSQAMLNIINRIHQNILSDYDEYLLTVMPVNSPFNGLGEEYETAVEDTLVEPTDFLSFVGGSLDNWHHYILEATAIEGWQPNYGEDAKLKHVKLQGEEYFILLCSNYGKEILSAKEKEKIDSIVYSLRTNERTKGYFDRDNQARLGDDVTVHLQMPIYFEYKGVQCKALLDMVVIVKDSRGNLLSILPIDIKTMSGNTFNFPASVRKRRYDIQGAWYTMALAIKYNLSPIDTVKYIFPFVFIVESSTRQGKPLVFQMSRHLLQIGYTGQPAVEISGVRVKEEIPGYKQYMERYIYHMEHGWREEPEIQESGTEPIIIDWEDLNMFKVCR